MGKLDGNVAIVAGSSRGTGKGIALAYAVEGARVAVVARSESAGALPGTIGETAEAIRAAGGEPLPIRCDITDQNDVEAMVRAVLDRWGTVDVLVNSAVLILYEGTLDTPEEDWSRIFDINVKGAFLLTKAVLPVMIAKRRGSIVHLTGTGAFNPALVTPSVGATKAAMERFVTGVAYEMRDHNIAVNCLDPGAIKTERAVARLGDGHDWSQHAVPADVGPLAVHMAVQDGASLTGTVLRRLEWRPPT